MTVEGQEPRGERERSGEVEGQCCLEALRRLPTLGEPSAADIVDEHVNPADTTADLVSEAPVFTNGERVSDDEIDGVVTGLTSELGNGAAPSRLVAAGDENLHASARERGGCVEAYTCRGAGN